MTSGYVSGYRQFHTGGLSSVTVDNTGNSSDVFVKLFALDQIPPSAARVFFVKGGDSFKVSNIRAGTFDIRYRDLNSGALARSEPFVLRELDVEGGTQFSEMRLTLYTVRGGNTRMSRINESEF